MKKLIILSGVPGSGKSYLSDTIKKIRRKHVYIVSSDQLREDILGTAQDFSCDATMWSIFYNLPRVYSKDEDALVILDATHIKSALRLRVCNDLRQYFDETDLVYFKIDYNIVRMQNIGRKYPVRSDVLETFIESIEEPQKEEYEAFDNIFIITDANISNAVNEILKK